MYSLNNDNNHRQQVYVQALLGDKILGWAVTAALVEQQRQQTKLGQAAAAANVVADTGELTQQLSAVVSNQTLAQHASVLLNIDNTSDASEWELATRVEAAVSAVHDINPAAVHELAAYLVAAVIHTRATTNVAVWHNSKGILLEAGGALKCRRTGGSDHQPIFTATARLGMETATAQGPNKKRAEMIAASRLVMVVQQEDEDGDDIEMEEDDEEMDKTMISVEYHHNHNSNDELRNDTLDEWVPFAPQSSPTAAQMMMIRLQEGETLVEWWKRGAQVPRKAFHRALMAPLVFDTEIVAVDSWTKRQYNNSDATAVLMVIQQQEQPGDKNNTASSFHTLPIQTAASATKARAAAGLALNRLIADLVRV